MRAGPVISPGATGQQGHAPMLQILPDPFVDNHELYLEGLTTWMLKRVLGRLDRARERGNNGQMRKYQEGITWLQRTLARIPSVGLEERKALFRALSVDDELSEDDNSPSWNADEPQRNAGSSNTMRPTRSSAS
eukprot:s1683_g4.t1